MVLVAAPSSGGYAQDEVKIHAKPGKTIKVEAPGAGSAAAKVVGCDSPTKTEYPKEPGQEVSALNWRFKVFVSDTDGLVVRDIFLGPRQMANDFRLPYYEVPVTFVGVLRCELKPDSQDQKCRSRLVDFAIETSDSERIVAKATYAIDKFPRNEKLCLLIKQNYVFSKEHLQVPYHCEPFGQAPCARFAPIVSYQLTGDDSADRIPELRTFQRLHFLVDGRAVNHAGIGIDCDAGPLSCPGTDPAPVIKMRGGNPLSEEAVGTAFHRGKSGESPISADVDHFHQSALKVIDEPGLTHFGCPECVHVHFRWSALLKSSPGQADVRLLHWVSGLQGSYPQFGGGKPLIPPGSRQSVSIYVTSDLAKDPANASELVRGRSLENASPVLWYAAGSSARSDEFFGHGGFFNSYGLNVLEHRRGGTVLSVQRPGEAAKGKGYPAHDDARRTLDGGPIGSAVIKVGSDIIYHFSDKKPATFDLLCLTIDPKTASENVRRVDFFAGDNVDGPWKKLVEFEVSSSPRSIPSKRSGLTTNCEEISVPTTTARYLKLHVGSTWNTLLPNAVVGHLRVFGLLEQ
jgi:hypothetical protein